MALPIDQINRLTSKEIILLASLLCTVVEGTDFWCPEEQFLWQNVTHEKQIIWPTAIASARQIASDCIDISKQMLTRTCSSRTKAWDPNLTDTESHCVYYREPYEKYGKCPPDYIESKTGDICYQKINGHPGSNHCLHTSASSLSFLDLSTEEQFNILQEVLESQLDTGSRLSTVGLPAQNTMASGEIDSTTENVELQWLLPGRYGSILKLSNKSFSVTCTGYKNLCHETCLSMDISHSSTNKPFALILANCGDISSVVCVSRKNSFVRDIGCSTENYYRVGYATDDNLTYSIKMFGKPLMISEYSAITPGTIIERHCEGNKIFHMDSVENLIIYRQLASIVKLRNQDRCLFGISWLNAVVTRTRWGRVDPTYISFTNWDKSVDFSTVESRSDSYLTVNSKGQWSWEESATCIVCGLDEAPTLSELILQFSTLDFKLILIVISQESLWRESNAQLGFLCFAMIANSYIEVAVEEVTSQNNWFSLANVGAGSYNCSGHLISKMTYVRSNSVTAFGMIVVFYVQYHCDVECVEPFDVTGKFEKFLSSLFGIAAMKIDDLRYIRHDANYTDINVNLRFHVMISVEDEFLPYNERNEIGLSEYELDTYYLLKVVKGLSPSDHDYFPFDILSVASREFCLPDTLVTPHLNWKAAKLGETIELSKKGFTFTRTCSGDGAIGAVWNDHVIQIKSHNPSPTARSLIELHNNFRSTQQIPEVLSNLSTTLQNVTLNESDVFIISEIFERLSNFLTSNLTVLSICDLRNVFSIFNDLMVMSQDVATATSSQLNSTNSLLASLDEILINQAQNVPELHCPLSRGVVSIKTPLIENYILDPVVSGFSGIELVDVDVAADNEDFSSYVVRFLQPNQSLEAVLLNENVVLASFVPQKLIETWKSPKIIFTLFFNDILFQTGEKPSVSPDGSIISLTILNSDAKLSSSIPFFFKANTALYHRTSYLSDQFCGHWRLSGSEWNANGCLLNNLSFQITDTILCECSHLTHFGNLVNTEILFGENDEKALNLVTLAGCSLSLAGIIGIFLTAIIFRTWRSKTSSKFLLQLSAAVAVQMILLIFINSNDDVLITISQNVYGCIAIGALIHYSILVMFFWMLIVAYLQFVRYVMVLKQIATANFLLKSSIFGWGMPVLPVFIVVAVDPKSYIPSANVQFCYPSGYGLWFGLLAPVILIVAANSIIFIAVIVSLVKGSSKSAACKVNDKHEAIWSQLRLSVFLFFVLGISWIFAFLSDRYVVFSYLFCLTATLQGLVLFFYFVILDPVARNLWKRLLTKCCCYRS